jgi:hypothetical protein
MSAYDPKRTSLNLIQPLSVCRFKPLRWLVLTCGGSNETAGFNQARWWRGPVAARRACPANPEGADHRINGLGHCGIAEPMDLRFFGSPARTRMDRGPQYRG